MHTIIFFKEKCLDICFLKYTIFVLIVMQETKKKAVDLSTKKM